MESRKESLSALKICRFCLSQDDTLTSLYKRSRIPKNAISLPLKIFSCVGIEVYPSDKMPTYICGRCQFFMDLSYEYKRICRQTDENILQYIQTGTPLESIAWPNGLSKIYRESNGKPNEVAVMKAVVEDGTTVQVTTQDSSDTDAEDDENVYNIKIGDTSDEGSKSASIKVISDKQETPKAKTKRGAKVSPPLEEVMKNSRPCLVEEGSWPCTECKCTYPLQQLLELHKVRKHRTKNEECDQCGAKFFTKYDMHVHQSRHTNVLSFQCAACDKTFKRLILLKRHEKLMHADLPQQQCPNCPASFLSSDELYEHQKKHARVQVKANNECVICEKTFPNKAGVQRHMDLAHDQNMEYRCDYCPERFSSVAKLAKHVRSHAAGKTYPCKYCDKTFVKSHHYTRHLRMKHRGNIRNRRGPFGEVEEYRCDQCDANFGTQDDLIYHSAIHATQNLTCPLCQEKFHDVEAVTMHIKAHASGPEFMCDYCELIFTTKAKLENHLTIAHVEELRSEQSLELDESSVEIEGEDDDEDNAINLKEEDGEMVVEIKKADEFMLTNYQGESEDKLDNTNSEDSEAETYASIGPADTLDLPKKDTKALQLKSAAKSGIELQSQSPSVTKNLNKIDNQTVSIIRKAEEIKRKAIQQRSSDQGSEKRDKIINKVESTTSIGGNDKSLRLLEKELQELKRTNTRTDTGKVSSKSLETIRNRRPQIHTSTPKIRNADEKKSQPVIKFTALEKKMPDRRMITKENKEPKEIKDNKNNNEKDKSVVKNGTNEKSNVEEGVRRSTRPSKIKDYAKMIRESSQDSDESEEDSDEIDDDDEEFKEIERTPEPPRAKLRRSSTKPPPAKVPPAGATPAPAPRKRGRPRKDATQIPNKVKKDDNEEIEQTKQDTPEQENNVKGKEETSTSEEKVSEIKKTTPERGAVELIKPSPGVLVSPTGQTLKKVPVKSLPPGVKALPLPVNARLGSAELCEMQIGKKVVKVQKIVMTKAEVEAMAKKGLVEMKDGTMVLKQGIKLPQQDASVIKQSLTDGGEKSKESPSKKDKAAPSRCDFGDDTS